MCFSSSFPEEDGKAAHVKVDIMSFFEIDIATEVLPYISNHIILLELSIIINAEVCTKHKQWIISETYPQHIAKSNGNVDQSQFSTSLRGPQASQLVN